MDLDRNALIILGANCKRVKWFIGWINISAIIHWLLGILISALNNHHQKVKNLNWVLSSTYFVLRGSCKYKGFWTFRPHCWTSTLSGFNWMVKKIHMCSHIECTTLYCWLIVFRLEEASKLKWSFHEERWIKR